MVAGSALLATGGRGGAGDSRVEFVPEVNAFMKVAEHARLFLLADLTQGLSEGGTDGAVGIHLDVTLKPIFGRRRRKEDWERERYLWARIGFQRSGTLDDREGGAAPENRGIAELTGRVSLPVELWLVNRARVDIRDMDGDFSQRFRYRLGIEREFNVGGLAVEPYTEAEVFYDTRFDAWSRQVYKAGAEVEFTKNWRIEPYYGRQEDQRSSPAHLDRVGLVLKTYW